MNRIVVQEQLFHQAGDADPTNVGRPWSYRLQTDEQPYQRLLTVKQEKHTLQSGWIGDNGCSMLYISNRRGSTVTVSIGTGTVLLPSGQDMRLPQCDVGQMSVWCETGEAQIQYVVFPA